MLVIKIPFLFKTLKGGDVVVFRHPAYGVLIKQVESNSTALNVLNVIGTHENSIDSRHFGPVPYAMIIGKVIWHIRKPAA